MDFSELDDEKIKALYNKSFSFTCSQNCDEVFEFTFINGSGNDSKLTNPASVGQQKPHYYEIDLHGATTGKEVVDRLYNTVVNNPPRDPAVGNTIKVSHSNTMIKESDTKLVIRANTYGAATPQKAIDDFLNKKLGGKYGKADFAEIAGFNETIVTNIFDIQYGTEADHNMPLEIERMNSTILGIKKLSVMTERKRHLALDSTKEAMATINRQRANIGAQQNRLEHTIANENNIVENTTASESRLRDADIAKETSALALQGILEQAGISVISQANQTQQGVLKMLQ